MGRPVSTAISPSAPSSNCRPTCRTTSGRRVRVAGRIVSRRIGGKVHFLDLKDWSGQPTLRTIKGEREGDSRTGAGPVEPRSRS